MSTGMGLVWFFGVCFVGIVVVLMLLRGGASRKDVGLSETGSSSSGVVPDGSDINSPSGSAEPIAKNVGSAVCGSCHSSQHQSYLLTAHSRAMGLVKPELEPPDGEFFHEASGRHYSVFRRDGQLWHSESRAPRVKEAGA
ncbi:MAG: hypothetical protein WCK86_22280, partial [Planctomycetia bacterium]